MAVCGIYAIEIGTLRYVGASKHIYHRWNTHRFNFRHGSNPERLQRAYDELGEACTKYTILEECPANLLPEREKFWIDKLFNADDGLNTYRMDDPPPGWRKGVKRTAEHQRKLTQAIRERAAKPSYRQEMREKSRRYPPEKIKDMYRLRSQGHGVNAIARKLDVSPATVSKQLRGLINPDLHAVFSEQFYW